MSRQWTSEGFPPGAMMYVPSRRRVASLIAAQSGQAPRGCVTRRPSSAQARASIWPTSGSSCVLLWTVACAAPLKLGRTERAGVNAACKRRYARQRERSLPAVKARLAALLESAPIPPAALPHDEHPRVPGQGTLPQVRRAHAARHPRVHRRRGGRRPRRSWAASVWVVKAQIHAGGRGKGGGVKVAKSIDEVRDWATKMLGMKLVTHQTGPAGKRREAPADRGRRRRSRRSTTSAFVVDRAQQRVVLMASSEGGVNIEEVAEKTPEKIHKVAIDPATGLKDAEAEDIARKIGIPAKLVPQARDLFMKASTSSSTRLDASLVEVNPLITTERRQRGRARRQDQLRLQRALPPRGRRRDARPRRGGPRRGRGVEVRPHLHPARRRHRLPGERRGPRDGDDGHDQALRRHARRTSSTWAAAPPPRR